jgi:hypothetical protein
VFSEVHVDPALVDAISMPHQRDEVGEARQSRKTQAAITRGTISA